MDEKKVAAYSQIQRALGMIEGVSFACTNEVAQALVDAIQMIDAALEAVLP